MIGQTIATRRPWRLASAFFLILTGLLIGLAVFLENPHWAVAAILPLFLASFLAPVRDPPFQARLGEDSLEVFEPPLTIPYDSIQGLKGKGRPADPHKQSRRSYPIRIAHKDGVLEIPASLDVPSDKVYHFLHAQFSPGGSRKVNPVLAGYLQRQETTFGSERVWSYRARKHLGLHFPRRTDGAILLALFFTGVAWTSMMLAGKAYLGWAGGGIAMALVFGPWYLVVRFQGDRPPGRLRDWRAASLVISPVGLALVQGDLKGELRWDEVRDVKFPAKVRGLRISAADAMPGMLLVVEGARIVIANVYDRPLAIIYERIREYWQ